jgi:hypothetical protein
MPDNIELSQIENRPSDGYHTKDTKGGQNGTEEIREPTRTESVCSVRLLGEWVVVSK